jgi:hypothetical protein
LQSLGGGEFIVLTTKGGTFAFLALVVAAAPAFAQSLEARKMQAQQEADLAGKVALTNKVCGGDLKARIDWSTFDAAETLKNPVVSWCAAGLDALEDLCGEALGKQAVNEKVKALVCAGSSEPSVKLADGVLTFAFSFAPNQNKLLVRGFLEKNL